jgi:hypothetical protein
MNCRVIWVFYVCVSLWKERGELSLFGNLETEVRRIYVNFIYLFLVYVTFICVFMFNVS